MTNLYDWVVRVSGHFQYQLERLIRYRYPYTIQPWEQIHHAMSRYLRCDLNQFLSEAPLADLQQWISRRLVSLPANPPMPLLFNADRALAALVYAVCRGIKPQCVITTGVAYGMLEAHILTAMASNSQGVLHSIDLPPPDAEEWVGHLVPNNIQEHWQLYQGSSRRLLPSILENSDPVELFVHDSLHTAPTIRWELDTVQPYLADPGIVFVDDINQNPTFAHWCEMNTPTYAGILQQQDKDVMCGIAILCDHYPG